MRVRNAKKHSSKLNIILVIAALLALFVTVVSVSYAWIETANSLTVYNDASNVISAKGTNAGVVQVDRSNSNTVSLNDYIANVDSLFLAPAKRNASGQLTIKRDNGTYTAATTNDIGNNYIEFNVPFTVAERFMFSFTADSKITVGGSTNNPVKVLTSVDGATPKVFNSALEDTNAKKVAFSAAPGATHYLKVMIWLDATDEAAAEALAGKDVSINLTLETETDTSGRIITLAESAHAQVSATYNDGVSNLSFTEGQSRTMAPGTKVYITVKTADGIVKGDNGDLNGFKFKNIQANSTVLKSTPGSTNSTTHIATTTYTYTVPDDGTSGDIVIKTNTDMEEFHIVGPGIKENSVWDSANNTTMLSNYDPINNCVYAALTANGTGGIFKISEKGVSSTYRDSTKYSVSLNAPNFEKGGHITTLKSDGQASPNTCISYTTSVSGEKILVVYYLSDNTVEVCSGNTYVAQYTVSANVSTSGGGTAQVTHSANTGTTIKVNRRAAIKTVSFNATADEGYRFVGWSSTNGGAIKHTENPYSQTITSDLTLYANFKKVYKLNVNDQEKLTAKDSGNNTITFSNNSAEILEGTNVTLTAVLPDRINGYKVTWTVDGTVVKTDKVVPNGSSAYTINNIQTDHNVTVEFERLYKFTFTKTPASDSKIKLTASISGQTATLTSPAYLENGTTVVLTASKTANNYRVSWKVNGTASGAPADLISSTSTTKSVTINSADVNVLATFTRLYKLSYSATPNDVAVISASSNSTSVSSGIYLPAGTSVVVSVRASNNNPYEVTWSGVDTPGSPEQIFPPTGTSSRTVTMNSDKTVTAALVRVYKFEFVNNSASDTNTKLTAKVGSTAITSPAYLKEGTVVNLTASAGSLPYNVKWTVDGVVAGTANTINGAANKTVTMTAANMKVEATFSRLYKLTVNATNCSYSADGVTFTDNVAYVAPGTKVTITATAPTLTNYNVVWRVNNAVKRDVSYTGDNQSYSDTYTTPAINSDTVVAVSFSKLYALTYSIVGSGGVTGQTLKTNIVGAPSATMGGGTVTQYVSNKNLPITFTATRPDDSNFYKVTAQVRSNGTTANTHDTHYKGDATINVNMNGDTTVVVTETKVQTVQLNISSQLSNSLTLTANCADTSIGYTQNLCTDSSTGGHFTVPVGTKITITSTAKEGYNCNGFTVTGATATPTGVNKTEFTVGTANISVVANATEITKRTIYFRNNNNWAEPKAYAWDNNNNHNAQYPGAVMTKVDGYDNIYKIELDPGYTKVIFSYNSDANKTFDLSIPNESANTDMFDINTYRTTQNGQAHYLGTWVKFPPEYTVTISSVSNATITVKRNDTNATVASGGKVPANTQITVSVTPITGYLVKSIKIGSDSTNYTTEGTQTKTYTVNSNVTVSAVVEKKVALKRIYFDVSPCTWFLSQSFYPAINYSGHSDFIYLKNNTKTVGSKTYFYCDVPTNVTGITLRRQNDIGSYYNAHAIANPTATQDLFTLDSQWDSGSVYGTWSVYVPKKTINVYVINYIYNAQTNYSNYKIRCVGGSYSDKDVTCVNKNTTKSRFMSEWNSNQTFQKFTADIPTDTTEFKFHIGDTTWFGSNGNASTYNTVYVYNYSGDKAIYTKE
ncbi:MULTISPECIES: starch-binding protein [unclassified Ruminococcus]|uniref:InlB B-repeat-containing protein n=1 Tax=unclassified Ruminococcus TaxID=2608920 RepID=UPI00210ABCC3|nr:MULTISPECIES: starch-binding protein [unclassified Ruminococcus]MCQ4021518.1 starch-binding protein [Ruminococcus sp. zg-924]MCQ4113963.1 starch-binding protein [Ruminococcus sp. zg-921]